MTETPWGMMAPQQPPSIFEREPDRTLNPGERATVAVTARGDLLSGVRDLAASVLESGLSRGERLSRAERAAEAAGGVGVWLDALDPYRSGAHARSYDLFTATDRDAGDTKREDAANRLVQRATRDQLALELRAGVDLTGLQGAPVGALVSLPDAFPLLGVADALPVGMGPAGEVPGPWTAVPDAVIGWDGDQAQTVPNLDMVPSDVVAAWWWFNVSRQAYSYGSAFAAEYDRLAEHQVRKALEAKLVTTLTSGAPTATDFEAAEVAIGAVWAPGPDLVLTSGPDLPKVRRAYAAVFPDPADRPAIRGSFGVPAGTAVVLATPGVQVEASTVQWMVKDAPKVFGREVAAYMYGRAAVRVPGAVQTVSVA